MNTKESDYSRRLGLPFPLVDLRNPQWKPTKLLRTWTQALSLKVKFGLLEEQVLV
jgi:hypothetical protein